MNKQQNRFGKPVNGIRGLKFWKEDLLAGLQVSFVALPLCLGIAIASGAPPSAGLISAIIAGFIFPFIGGSYMTISGPAAGLAPILLAGILTLGQGDMAQGYHYILIAVFLVGIIQTFLSVFRAGEIVRIFPSAVLHGLLSAIGVMMIVQQLPKLFGFIGAPHTHVSEAIRALPQAFAGRNDVILSLGIFFLAFLFLLEYVKSKKILHLRFLPASLIVVSLSIVASYILHIDPMYITAVPANILHGIVLPPFTQVLQQPALWQTIIVLVIVLVLVDSTESLTTASAVDRMDPYKRRSKPNKILFAMGVSNIASSLLGGLTIIPGGIKSTANIEAGGKTLWTNFYTASFLLIFVLLAGALINHIALTALAAILIFIGWKLCSPRVWQDMLRLGNDQFLIFVITFFAILSTDLLTGMIIGIACYMFFLLYILTPSMRYVLTGDISLRYVGILAKENAKHIFGNPIDKITKRKNLVVIKLHSLTNFNLYHLRRILHELPDHITVDLVFSDRTKIVEHTAMMYVYYVKEIWGKQHHDQIIVEGLRELKRFSRHPHSGAYNIMLLEKEHFILKHTEDERILFE